MNTRRAVVLSGLIVALSLVVSVWAYPQVPDQMATHWDAAGQVNGTMSKLWGLFLIPVLSGGLVALFLVLPQIDPRRENYAPFREYYNGFIVVMTAFLALVHGASVAYNLGYDVDITAVTLGSVGLLLIYLGFLLDHAEPNWFVGIRTPWTLSDETVWDDTHHLGARLFKLSGVLALLGLLFNDYALYFLLVPVLATTVVTLGYSFYRYRQLQGSEGGMAN